MHKVWKENSVRKSGNGNSPMWSRITKIQNSITKEMFQARGVNNYIISRIRVTSPHSKCERREGKLNIEETLSAYDELQLDVN
mmetsp:Transcript_10664/g.26128  ORF Transcript_10664/g.26128 Transcript_10664/m.26128 type:complete len:83 (-) Transcript_10664:184-432(-)